MDVHFGIYSSKFTDTVVPITPGERVRLNSTLFKAPIDDDQDLQSRVEKVFTLAFSEEGESSSWVKTIIRHGLTNNKFSSLTGLNTTLIACVLIYFEIMG